MFAEKEIFPKTLRAYDQILGDNMWELRGPEFRQK